MTPDYSKVTRVVVVPYRHSSYTEHWADNWDVQLQDDGQTLKLFAKDGYGSPARAARDVALAKFISTGGATGPGVLQVQIPEFEAELESMHCTHDEPIPYTLVDPPTTEGP